MIKNEKKTHLMEAILCLFICKEKHSEKLKAYFTINRLLRNIVLGYSQNVKSLKAN